MEANAPPPPASQLFAAWWHLTQLLKRQVAPVLAREHGLDFKDFLSLNAIERGACYPGLLCERMALTPSAASRAVDELVKGGLLERGLDPADLRRVQLRLTERGTEALNGARGTMITLLDQGLHGLSAEQVGSFMTTLRQLAHNLDRSAPPLSTPDPHAQEGT